MGGGYCYQLGANWDSDIVDLVVLLKDPISVYWFQCNTGYWIQLLYSLKFKTHPSFLLSLTQFLSQKLTWIHDQDIHVNFWLALASDRICNSSHMPPFLLLPTVLSGKYLLHPSSFIFQDPYYALRKLLTSLANVLPLVFMGWVSWSYGDLGTHCICFVHLVTLIELFKVYVLSWSLKLLITFRGQICF
jgi:hypothetical protein